MTALRRGFDADEAMEEGKIRGTFSVVADGDKGEEAPGDGAFGRADGAVEEAEKAEGLGTGVLVSGVVMEKAAEDAPPEGGLPVIHGGPDQRREHGGVLLIPRPRAVTRIVEADGGIPIEQPAEEGADAVVGDGRPGVGLRRSVKGGVPEETEEGVVGGHGLPVGTERFPRADPAQAPGLGGIGVTVPEEARENFKVGGVFGAAVARAQGPEDIETEAGILTSPVVPGDGVHQEARLGARHGAGVGFVAVEGREEAVGDAVAAVLDMGTAPEEPTEPLPLGPGNPRDPFGVLRVGGRVARGHGPVGGPEEVESEGPLPALHMEAPRQVRVGRVVPNRGGPEQRQEARVVAGADTRPPDRAVRTFVNIPPGLPGEEGEDDIAVLIRRAFPGVGPREAQRTDVQGAIPIGVSQPGEERRPQGGFPVPLGGEPEGQRPVNGALAVLQVTGDKAVPPRALFLRVFAEAEEGREEVATAVVRVDTREPEGQQGIGDGTVQVGMTIGNGHPERTDIERVAGGVGKPTAYQGVERGTILTRDHETKREEITPAVRAVFATAGQRRRDHRQGTVGAAGPGVEEREEPVDAVGTGFAVAVNAAEQAQRGSPNQLLPLLVPPGERKDASAVGPDDGIQDVGEAIVDIEEEGRTVTPGVTVEEGDDPVFTLGGDQRRQQGDVMDAVVIVIEGKEGEAAG